MSRTIQVKSMLGWATCAAALWASTALAVQRHAPPPPSPQKQAMIDLGIKEKTAQGLYEYFKEKAHGGTDYTRANYAKMPDWSGLWTRADNVFFFDPDQKSMTAYTTAKLTPKYKKMYMQKLAQFDKGNDYDPLSAGNPAGMPRWLVEPFLREFIVTPRETYLITEQMNEIRRIYTDGRGHVPKADAYPLWEGDSIGFWDGDKLVIWTNDLKAGSYQRIQPNHSNEAQVVSVWQKTDSDTIQADVWIYDPLALEQPWYTKQTYKHVDDQNGALRIRYWNFVENSNNTVVKNKKGGSKYAGFTFDEGNGEGNGKSKGDSQ